MQDEKFLVGSPQVPWLVPTFHQFASKMSLDCGRSGSSRPLFKFPLAQLIPSFKPRHGGRFENRRANFRSALAVKQRGRGLQTLV